jgi:integrase
MARSEYGRGSLEELLEGKKYRLRIYAGKDPVSGKTRQPQLTFYGTKTAASKRLNKFVSDFQAGQLDPTTMTVKDCFDRWIAHLGPSREATTLREHKRVLEKDILPALGHLKLAKLTAHDIDAYMTAALNRGLSANSVRRRYAVIHAGLEQAVKWGWALRNVSDQSSQPRKPQEKSLVVPTPAELSELYAAALGWDTPMGNMMAAAIGISALFGTRRGESNSMRWNDADLDLLELKVHRSRAIVGGMPIEKGTKSHQGRDLAGDEVAVNMLKRRMAYQRQVAELAGVAMVANPYFLSLRADGAQPVNPDTISHQFSKLCNGRWRFHDLRHWQGTQLDNAGVSGKVIQKRLGHASQSTSNIYIHSVEGRDRAAAAEIGKLLKMPELEEG